MLIVRALWLRFRLWCFVLVVCVGVSNARCRLSVFSYLVFVRFVLLVAFVCLFDVMGFVCVDALFGVFCSFVGFFSLSSRVSFLGVLLFLRPHL